MSNQTKYNFCVNHLNVLTNEGLIKQPTHMENVPWHGSKSLRSPHRRRNFPGGQISNQNKDFHTKPRVVLTVYDYVLFHFYLRYQFIWTLSDLICFILSKTITSWKDVEIIRLHKTSRVFLHFISQQSLDGFLFSAKTFPHVTSWFHMCYMMKPFITWLPY